MVMEDGGVTNFKPGSKLMQPFQKCCTRINFFLTEVKHLYSTG